MYPVVALSLIPYGAVSYYLYERRLFKRENAAGLYPATVFCASLVVLEMALCVCIKLPDC